MDDKEKKLLLELEDKASSILSEFMLRTTKFEELVSVGSKFLVGFHEAVELLQRPAVHKASEVVDGIIKANETKRLKAYVQAGCINGHDGVQNISKLCDCQRGLQEYLAEAKVLLNEIQCFIDDIVSVLRTSNDIGHSGDGMVLQDTSFEEEAMELRSVQKPEVIECASIMGTIYSMVKQDYTMQEKIICSLSLESTSAELQSYCLMWSLRPFINDDIMHQAWKLIPQL
ncbi:uncharacterized protein LOC122058210 isoform X1 [Macadamia integrifolia]|uniref:uncharacterized protein LOC122058210 isoform X1 n=1 Tax=Macadamia integrifolia TaxID=60698 RepID=UPI001C5318F9|nr:uncharacterized protein LOC122058210 isoform X1 [Macadamia integrifolia]XP_042476706.1 uncharacterized protein LOC122058210 isoform X1 [Macadamia integrifolia]XP_042476707.1 uncharacterized protein LOC122058210 isoform X1 [Macadamia integrifolia]XP_042476708.1 uncharacterized protein LOC122058210 isoform X1 [Macadamia integrifolia]XP_042476709.1 uncharacterized protein LOC122058210 isoform X1 [Macadamia integrifolia]XP_042476710.1 uncharacterized protein LOC122058210 isoform X1 [Macadamia i